MSKKDFENKSLVYIVLGAYALNLLLGWVGYFCQQYSVTQLLLFQVGNAFAILASVMAARYVGLRGEQVAASAYILLGIAHGISLAALSRHAINVDRGMTIVMPMIPSLICVFWCSLYPMWLRLAGVLPIIFFTMLFVDVHLGNEYFGWPLAAGYATLQIAEVLWGIFLFRDWQKETKS